MVFNDRSQMLREFEPDLAPEWAHFRQPSSACGLLVVGGPQLVSTDANDCLLDSP